MSSYIWKKSFPVASFLFRGEKPISSKIVDPTALSLLKKRWAFHPEHREWHRRKDEYLIIFMKKQGIH
jgi:hypothetical protein